MLDLIKLRLIAYTVGVVAALSTITFLIGHNYGVDTCNTAHDAKASKAGIDQLKVSK